jgi:hypothetical protein
MKAVRVIVKDLATDEVLFDVEKSIETLY